MSRVPRGGRPLTLTAAVIASPPALCTGVPAAVPSAPLSGTIATAPGTASPGYTEASPGAAPVFVVPGTPSVVSGIPAILLATALLATPRARCSVVGSGVRFSSPAGEGACSPKLAAVLLRSTSPLAAAAAAADCAAAGASNFADTGLSLLRVHGAGVASAAPLPGAPDTGLSLLRLGGAAVASAPPFPGALMPSGFGPSAWAGTVVASGASHTGVLTAASLGLATQAAAAGVRGEPAVAGTARGRHPAATTGLGAAGPGALPNRAAALVPPRSTWASSGGVTGAAAVYQCPGRPPAASARLGAAGTGAPGAAGSAVHS